MAWDQELEDFKSLIDIRAYAADVFGYELDKRESCRNSSVLRNPATNDKIIVKRNGNGHYVYFSVRNNDDNGSIIDFIQNREGKGRKPIWQIRKDLRPEIGKPAPALPLFLPLEKTSKDRLKVEQQYRCMKGVAAPGYLTEERGISAAILQSNRFAGMFRVDSRNNVVFPHFDQQGLCGYEIKNKGFTGFAKHGGKGLWWSAAFKTDDCLVFTESAIDALSYAELHRQERTRYASIGGEMNPHQPCMIQAAIAKMTPGTEIIAAMDADSQGRKLAAMIEKAYKATGRHDLFFRVYLPPQEGADWNDLLRNRQTPIISFPIARLELAPGAKFIHPATGGSPRHQQ